MQNILNNTTYYAAGNLENTEDAENWRDSLAKELAIFGIKCLDPTKKMFRGQVQESEETRQLLKKWRREGRFDLISPFMKEIIRKDLRAVDISTFVVVKLEPSRPSFGTIHELVISSQQKKPILILINDRKQMPLWLTGLLDMNFVFETQEELINYLKRVNSGEEKIDQKYWKIIDF